MFRIRIFRTAVCVVLAFGTSSFQTSAQDLQEMCKTDIATYCAFVTPGDGRIASCLYAHSDRISDTCHQATAATDSILEMLFDRVNETYNLCSVDIQAHCSGTARGGGRIIGCLIQNKAKVNAECVQSIGRYSALVQ